MQVVIRYPNRIFENGTARGERLEGDFRPFAFYIGQ